MLCHDVLCHAVLYLVDRQIPVVLKGNLHLMGCWSLTSILYTSCNESGKFVTIACVAYAIRQAIAALVHNGESVLWTPGCVTHRD